MGKKEARETCLRRVFPAPDEKGRAVPTACLKKCTPILYKSSDKAGEAGREAETTCRPIQPQSRGTACLITT